VTTSLPVAAPLETPDHGATDEERALVRRMQSGDERAFDMFADHYVPSLYRFAAARLRGQPELVRDIVQATICDAIARIDSWRGEAPLLTWLCACCRNEIAMHFRRLQIGLLLVDLDEEKIATMELREPGPEDAAMEREVSHRVHETLDHLPPRYAAALRWKYLHGDSVQQIASRLRLSAKAAESLLTRARDSFRLLYQRGIS
jgi:RNA polymerase sigma-70 factor (ECF subfamily)